jgi:hypothetical protein
MMAVSSIVWRSLARLVVVMISYRVCVCMWVRVNKHAGATSRQHVQITDGALTALELHIIFGERVIGLLRYLPLPRGQAAFRVSAAGLPSGLHLGSLAFWLLASLT